MVLKDLKKEKKELKKEEKKRANKELQKQQGETETQGNCVILYVRHSDLHLLTHCLSLQMRISERILDPRLRSIYNLFIFISKSCSEHLQQCQSVIKFQVHPLTTLMYTRVIMIIISGETPGYNQNS